MWPWGHLALGYLLYSPLARLGWRRAPTGEATVALALATQTPDLIDKTLAWVFHVFPQGYALGHSVFFAIPVGVAAVLVGASRGWGDVGVAVAVGYWSHLVGDVLYAIALGEPYTVERVLWPLVEFPAYSRQFEGIGRALYYLARWLDYLAAADPTVVFAYVAPLLAAFLLWLADGAPALTDAYRVLTGRSRPGAG